MWKQVEGARHDTFWLGSVKIPIRGTPRSGSGPLRTSSTNAKLS